MNITKLLKEWVPTLIIALLIALVLNTYVIQGMRVPTGSMIPTIQIGDRIMVEKMMKFTHLKFGDVVVFHPPLAGRKKELFVKRLIGLPGDTIQVKNGFLYRNGEKVVEPYIAEKMTYSYGPKTVPPGDYFFLGDNRNVSEDSHLWPNTPYVKKDKIVGKALFVYFPLSQIGKL